MGREIRRVPAGWEHPKDERGAYIPLHKSFPYNEEEIKEGLEDGWLENTPPHYGIDVAPQWPEAERTHYRVYETVSEGTPTSPVFATEEEIVAWLMGQGYGEDSARGFVASGWAPSAACIGGVVMDGIAAMGVDYSSPR